MTLTPFDISSIEKMDEKLVSWGTQMTPLQQQAIIKSNPSTPLSKRPCLSKFPSVIKPLPFIRFIILLITLVSIFHCSKLSIVRVYLTLIVFSYPWHRWYLAWPFPYEHIKFSTHTRHKHTRLCTFFVYLPEKSYVHALIILPEAIIYWFCAQKFSKRNF